MGSTRVYVKPFKTDGTYEDDWTEVTKYVSKIGKIVIDSDSQEYQLGVYRVSNVEITFNNRDGKFSDIDNAESLFRYARNNSQVKVTWMDAEMVPLSGWITVPFFLAEEILIFDGVLSDESLAENAKTEEVPLTALGFTSLFDQASYVAGSINIGDLISEAIFTLLNQSVITDLLTLDIANILPDQDQTLDDVEFLSDQLVSDAVDSFLRASNSVLYIRDRTIYVASRDPSVDLKYTFYGQASSLGQENIIEAKNIRSGIARCFNYFRWENTQDDSVVVQKNNASIQLNGVRKVDISLNGFTDTTKRGNMLAALLAEFKDKKRELEINAPLDHDLATLNLSDKIDIDYPTVFNAEPGNMLPICGIAICGTAILPKGLWSLTLDTQTKFKVLSKSIEPEKETITLKVREI